MTGNDAGGSPSGNFDFTVCGPTASPTPATPCTATDYPVASGPALTAGAGNTSTTTSGAFTPTADGWWCFDDTYTGDGNYNASSDNTTDECFLVQSVPDAPTIGTATAGNAQATVTFTAPGFDGDSTINHYTATATDTTHSFNGGQTATGSSSPITVPGLTNGDSYTFTVTATNGIGTGPASAASNSATPTTLVPATITSADTTAVAAGKKVDFTVTATGSPASTISNPGGGLRVPAQVQGGQGREERHADRNRSGNFRGCLTFTLEASNGVSAPDYQAFTLNVLQITSGTATSFTAGNGSTTFEVTTSDTPANPTLAVTGLPAGLHFTDYGNGTGVINGPATAEKKAIKTYSATVKATSGATVASQTLKITIYS